MRRVEMDFDKHRGGNKQGWWKTKMDFDKGWNFSKSVSVDPTFIREMRVGDFYRHVGVESKTVYRSTPNLHSC